jgi:hypothetical protein
MLSTSISPDRASGLINCHFDLADRRANSQIQLNDRSFIHQSIQHKGQTRDKINDIIYLAIVYVLVRLFDKQTDVLFVTNSRE